MSFLGIVLVIGLVGFIVIQSIGIIRDLKSRKNNKSQIKEGDDK